MGGGIFDTLHKVTRKEMSGRYSIASGPHSVRQNHPTRSLLIQSKRHRSGSDFLRSYPEERVPTQASPIARANRDTAIAEVARHKRHPLSLQ